MKIFSMISAISFLSLFTLFVDNENVVFFRTYGYQQGEIWVIPMRVWVYEHRDVVEYLMTKIAASIGDPTPHEKENFKSRITYLVADDESREEVVFTFDNDPEKTEYRIEDEHGKVLKTDLNGIVEGVLQLPVAKASELLQRQSSQHGWLTFHAISKEHTGIGRVHLLEPQGLSVISDIDDTIKVTEIPAGGKIVVRNTFFRDFVAAPGMVERYQSLGEASFHYVSGGPWQLYEPLTQFLFGAGGFPEGTLHMKNVRKNLLNSDTWHDLQELAAGDATFRQKVAQISQIIATFPRRQFILIGDSGERDPEVYATIRAQFPNQIQAIWIRDVVNARENHPERLEGMTIIPAPTVVEGVSGLGT